MFVQMVVLASPHDYRGRIGWRFSTLPSRSRKLAGPVARLDSRLSVSVGVADFFSRFAGIRESSRRAAAWWMGALPLGGLADQLGGLVAGCGTDSRATPWGHAHIGGRQSRITASNASRPGAASVDHSRVAGAVSMSGWTHRASRPRIRWPIPRSHGRISLWLQSVSPLASLWPLEVDFI